MGGNVFDLTKPIKKENIEPTLSKFMEELSRIFPGAKKHFKDIRRLGSVGKKDISGDIDLAISEDSFKDIKEWDLDEKHIKELFDGFKKRSKSATDQQIMKRAILVALSEKIEEKGKDIHFDTKGTGGGSLFFAFPQYEGNKKTNEWVQIDLNAGNIDWLDFAYYSDVYKGNVKGLHRTQLMLSLFSNKGYTFSHNYGVKNKETQEITAKNPKEAIDLLNKLYGFNIDGTILPNYFKIQEFLKKNLSEEELNKIYDIYLKILDRTRADIPEDLQEYWIKNQKRLGLKGKFLPTNSNLIKYKTESVGFIDIYYEGET